MSNPPEWVKRSVHNRPSGDVSPMALAAGVVTAGDVNSQPTNTGGPMPPSQWAWIWFGLATLYLMGVYSGHVRIARER
jgi:hypothetical protein